ncbi:uracil-DNA glycosylase [Sphingomonas sp. ID0503]|uniref:uracil-DNA glycosylase n=1 Tax=Sphingomonas sp. ID0503 TaxID=3399691 RepID=UPI003AFB40B9
MVDARGRVAAYPAMRGEAALLASVIDWWETAGVDCAVAEGPRQWLRDVTPAAAQVAEPTPVITAPETLASFPGTSGDPACGLMIVVDMPDPDDEASLLTGRAGKLLDRMLAAIGLSRADVYLAPLSAERTTTGRIDPRKLAEIGGLARRHVQLAAPRLLVLLGDVPSRLFLGEPVPQTRGRLHTADIEGQAVRVLTSFHPRTLLQHPPAKAEAWADLRLIAAERVK